MKETRTVHEGGGIKGEKGTDYSAIPPEFMQALAAHYFDGCTKYPTAPDGLPNYYLGYPISANVEAFSRHWFAYLAGEECIPDDGTDDPTIGNHHLLAVVWHAIDMYRKSLGPWDNRTCTAVKAREAEKHG
jgi:hypothetical protein|tara:strand:- start:5257 stop:5649 length:393 start_codon:yes stop_codon:yes gene_type:complete